MKTAMNIQMAAQKKRGRTKTTTRWKQRSWQYNPTSKASSRIRLRFWPGNASADNPARPVGQVESSVLIPTSNLANVIDMDFLDPGFYDAKFVRTSTGHGFDMDLLDPGFYNAELVNSSRSIEGLQEDNII